MSISSSVVKPTLATTSEERWQAWEAKGAARDRALQRKVHMLAPLALALAAALSYLVIFR